MKNLALVSKPLNLSHSINADLFCPSSHGLLFALQIPQVTPVAFSGRVNPTARRSGGRGTRIWIESGGRGAQPAPRIPAAPSARGRSRTTRRCGSSRSSLLCQPDRRRLSFRTALRTRSARAVHPLPPPTLPNRPSPLAEHKVSPVQTFLQLARALRCRRHAN